jgi:hypothetical protein
VILAIAAALLLVIVLAGGYALAGSSVASSRVSSAESALDSALSHEVDFDKSISSVTGGFGALSSTTFDSKQYQTSVSQFVQSTQTQAADIQNENARLESAAGKLGDMQWLTLFNRGSLDHASARLAHAKKALAAGKAITADFVLDGQFFQALASALVDVANFSSQTNANDSTAAISTVVLLKSDVEKALPLSTAPGLPAEVHQYMVAFDTVAVDLQVLFNAALAGNQSAYNTATTKLNTDGAALDAIAMSNVDSEVKTFYQPNVTSYHQELQLASS